MVRTKASWGTYINAVMALHHRYRNPPDPFTWNSFEYSWIGTSWLRCFTWSHYVCSRGREYSYKSHPCCIVCSLRMGTRSWRNVLISTSPTNSCHSNWSPGAHSYDSISGWPTNFPRASCGSATWMICNTPAASFLQPSWWPWAHLVAFVLAICTLAAVVFSYLLGTMRNSLLFLPVWGNFSQLVLALEISWTAISFCKSCLALDSLFTVALSLTLPIDAVVSFHWWSGLGSFFAALVVSGWDLCRTPFFHPRKRAEWFGHWSCCTCFCDV